MRGTEEPNVSIDAEFWDSHRTLLDRLRTDIAWDTAMSARLTASFGEPYNYRQMVYPRRAMHRLLVPVQAALSTRFGVGFNNCLLNFYPDGRSKMGFHADDTDALVPGSGVAIVSLGGVRPITFRRRDDPSIRMSYELPGGSLLFMPNELQSDWVHAIKRRRHAEPRISLTWRAFQKGDG